MKAAGDSLLGGAISARVRRRPLKRRVPTRRFLFSRRPTFWRLQHPGPASALRGSGTPQEACIYNMQITMHVLPQQRWVQ